MIFRLSYMLATSALAVTYVLATSQALPSMVASHFNAAGIPDGRLPHDYYVWLMVAIVGVLPLVLAFLPEPYFGRKEIGFSLPNKAYWLAPERCEQTIASLRERARLLALVFMAFLAYVHWLVVQANAARPIQLASHKLIIALVVFAVALAIWMIALYRRFKTIPDPSASLKK